MSKKQKKKIKNLKAKLHRMNLQVMARSRAITEYSKRADSLQEQIAHYRDEFRVLRSISEDGDNWSRLFPPMASEESLKIEKNIRMLKSRLAELRKNHEELPPME